MSVDLPPRLLRASPLTAAAFSPFGDVIETAGHAPLAINQRTCERFDDLARIDVLEAAGRPLLSIFRAAPRPLPFEVRMLERHPLSSQAFYPLDGRPFLIVVAEGTAAPRAHQLRAFLSSGLQGVNFRRNTWHHGLIAIGEVSNFLVVDRGGPSDNCEECAIGDALVQVSIA
jgi:ureidoglycolate lyase